MAVAFIKRLATAVRKGWDDRIENASLCHTLAETLTTVREADPVEGIWCMGGKKNYIRGGSEFRSYSSCIGNKWDVH